MYLLEKEVANKFQKSSESRFWSWNFLNEFVLLWNRGNSAYFADNLISCRQILMKIFYGWMSYKQQTVWYSCWSDHHLDHQNFYWTFYRSGMGLFLRILWDHWPITDYNWIAPWKNRISSTTMKLRKSLVKPVTLQNISSCLVLPPEIVMHDAFNVILWTSADICVIVHDDVGWKNWTTQYSCRFLCHVTGFTSDFRLLKTSTDIRLMHDDLGWKNRTTYFGELAAVD